MRGQEGGAARHGRPPVRGRGMEGLRLASDAKPRKAMAVLAAVAGVVGASAALGQPAPPAAGGAGPSSAEAGRRIYRDANCVGCHRWHGGGGGGYGGAAMSLRATRLTREQIVEVVRCGRPNSGMPHFERDAYAANGCYGVTREELGPAAPPAAARFLRPREVEVVVDYVLAEIKGKGEPDYADCAAFFGDGSRMCQSYRTERPGGSGGGGPAPGPTPAPAGGGGPSGG